MALYLRKKLENKAEIAVWQITETEDELWALSSVPNDEMEEIIDTASSIIKDQKRESEKTETGSQGFAERGV